MMMMILYNSSVLVFLYATLITRGQLQNYQDYVERNNKNLTKYKMRRYMMMMIIIIITIIIS
jgi:hypothetical protein